MGSIGTMCLQSDIRIGVRQDEGAVDVALFALVAHDQSRFKAHVGERLVEVPRHAKAGAPTHPRINIVLVTIVEFAGAGRTPRLLQTDNFRQILVGDIRDLVAEVYDLFEIFWGHTGMGYEV